MEGRTDGASPAQTLVCIQTPTPASARSFLHAVIDGPWHITFNAGASWCADAFVRRAELHASQIHSQMPKHPTHDNSRSPVSLLASPPQPTGTRDRSTASPATGRRTAGIIAWLIAFHTLLAYGLVEWFFILLVVSLGVLYYRIGALGALTVSLALVACTVIYGMVLKITGLEDSIYYRPDEKYVRFDYANNHRVYQGNIRIDATMPHGDLRAMSNENIAEPRRMLFHTDSDGFRNERDYHGQGILLVGDSFIAGNSNSQEDLLVTQLRRNHGLDTYSLAYPGNVTDYAAYIRGFVKRHGENVRVILFLFEGNDFEESRGRKTSALARNGRRYYEMFSTFNTYRVTMSLYKRLTRGRSIRAGSDLELAELGGRKMAFYKRYVDVTRRSQSPDPEGFEQAIESIRPYIDRVYFIPTKYRVYSRHLNPDETLPNVQWDFLNGICIKYVFRCTNLTAALVQQSDRLLAKGEYTWWRDDTHWNRQGIAVAARVVAEDQAAR